MKRDVQATQARNFQDPNSFVFKDGREWLEGKDWAARKFELLKRCHGRCEHGTEHSGGFVRCINAAEHPHHKVKRSVAHDDRLANLIGLCWFHHYQAHPEKQLMNPRSNRDQLDR